MQPLQQQRPPVRVGPQQPHRAAPVPVLERQAPRARSRRRRRSVTLRTAGSPVRRSRTGSDQRAEAVHRRRRRPASSHSRQQVGRAAAAAGRARSAQSGPSARIAPSSPRQDDGDGTGYFLPTSRRSARGGERGDERLLGDLDAADHLHPLLALLLLLQQLALAGDVAAVALGEHVLADRADGLAGDDPGADRGLDRHLELLARDQLLELAGQHHAVGVRRVLVHDRARTRRPARPGAGCRP